MFDRSTLLFSSVCGLKVFSILTVVPRRGLQQCSNNISVFILVAGGGGGCAARLFLFLFFPVQQTTSGIGHRVK